jgi:hypothetical protein
MRYAKFVDGRQSESQGFAAHVYKQRRLIDRHGSTLGIVASCLTPHPRANLRNHPPLGQPEYNSPARRAIQL